VENQAFPRIFYQEIFSRDIFKKYFQEIFSRNIFKKYFQEMSSGNIIREYPEKDLQEICIHFFVSS
jgi:hypothetical protein